MQKCKSTTLLQKTDKGKVKMSKKETPKVFTKVVNLRFQEDVHAQLKLMAGLSNESLIKYCHLAVIKKMQQDMEDARITDEVRTIIDKKFPNDSLKTFLEGSKETKQAIIKESQDYFAGLEQSINEARQSVTD